MVFVDLPAVGAEVQAGATLGEVESTKSVSEIYAPVTGTVVAVNATLAESPEQLNEDPYGEGWICEIEAGGPGQPRGAARRGRLPPAHRGVTVRSTGRSAAGGRASRPREGDRAKRLPYVGVFCHNCGHRNPSGVNFCSSCGSALANDVSETTDHAPAGRRAR